MRTLFISDAHLGCKYASADKLLAYLDSVKDDPELETVYIIGDFIDGWRFKKGNWSDTCTLVIRKVLTFIKKGVNVKYIAGNHDEFIRQFLGVQLGHLEFVDEAIHETADGRRLLIIHGDKFDMSVKYAGWLCKLGDIGYNLLLWINHLHRKIFKKSRWSLSQATKSGVKKAINYVGDFEKILADYAKSLGCDGVVCGHIHTPDSKKIGDIEYYNTGDWVETCSAIYENKDGSLEMYLDQ